MGNAYLKALVEEIDKTTESCRNLNLVLESFLHDFPYVEGIDDNLSISDVKEILSTNSRIEAKIKEFRNCLMKEMNSNG